MQLPTCQESESPHTRPTMLDLISFLKIKLDRGHLLKAKTITSWILHLSQTSATLAIPDTLKEGKNWASLPKLFSSLQKRRGKEEYARESPACWLHVPYSKWSECPERLGRSQNENCTGTQQLRYFPVTRQNINYTLHYKGRKGEQVWSAWKDLT